MGEGRRRRRRRDLEMKKRCKIRSWYHVNGGTCKFRNQSQLMNEWELHERLGKYDTLYMERSRESSLTNILTSTLSMESSVRKLVFAH